jgi:transposase-like protein
MKAYGLDLRERVVKFINEGASKVGAARRFDLGRRTVYRYLAAARKGTLTPKQVGDTGANSTRTSSSPTSKNIPTPPSRNSKPALASAITPSGCACASSASL